MVNDFENRLSLSWIMLKNGQTYFNNLVVYTARLLKHVWPFFNIMLEGLNNEF